MTWVAQTIAEFGRTVGIEGLALDGNGLAQLALAGGGSLSLEAGEDELLVYMVRPVSPHDTDARLRALGLCRSDRPWQWPVQTGRHGEDGLIFLVRLPEREVSLSSLEQALDTLTRLHAAARG